MSLEATTNAIEDHLIDSISFKLAPGASYVTDRRSVSFSHRALTFTNQKPELKSLKLRLLARVNGSTLQPSSSSSNLKTMKQNNCLS